MAQPPRSAWLEVAREHPRHVVLFALAAGLALGPISAPATVAAAVAAAAARAAAGARDARGRRGAARRGRRRRAARRAGRRGAARARGPALGGRGDDPRAGPRARPPRRRPRPARRARRDGRARLRVPEGPRRTRRTAGRHGLRRRTASLPARRRGPARPAPPRHVDTAGGARRRVGVADAARHSWPPVGAIVAVSGRIAPLGQYDAYQRRRGAQAALEVDRWRATGDVAWWPFRRAGRRAAARRGRARAGARRRRRRRCSPGWCSARTSGSPNDVRTDFKRSGLAHLLAVSGQNVVLLAMLVLGAGMALGLPLRARLARGARARRAVRAAGGRRAVDPARGRDGRRGARGRARRPAGSRWYALGLAAVVTLAVNPRASGEPGWQLSFAAVVGLLALVPRWGEALRRARVPGPLADAIAVTAAATLATAPLMALHFEQVSLASLPANLLAAPAVAPVMWLGMGVDRARAGRAGAVRAAERPQRLAAGLPGVGRARRRAAARGRPAGADRRPGRPGRVVRRRSGGAAARGTCVAAGRPVRRRLALPAALGAVPLAALALVVSHRGPPPPRPGELVVVVPRRRPGRRDAAAARRRLAARRHRAARRPDPAPARRGGGRSGSTRC